jgi:hypothetical protein
MTCGGFVAVNVGVAVRVFVAVGSEPGVPSDLSLQPMEFIAAAITRHNNNTVMIFFIVFLLYLYFFY